MPAPELNFPNFDMSLDPCVLEAQVGSRVLRCVGTNPHFNDPTSPQFSMVVDQWKVFLDKLDNIESALAISEGKIRTPAQTAEASVELDGEPCLLAYLAQSAGIRNVSFEPPSYSEAKPLLEKGHDPDAVSYYYYTRNLPQWYRMNPQPSLGDFFSAETNWGRTRLPRHIPELDFSYDALQRAHKKFFGIDSPFEPADPKNATFFGRQMAPDNPQTPPQRVARDCHVMRDQYQADQLWNAWEGGASLFVLSHALHIRGIEPALSAMKDVPSRKLQWNYNQSSD
ncbi:MAG TPA: hypothetical protein VF733_01555 [Candidatus Saccharimonadales bacterium]